MSTAGFLLREGEKFIVEKAALIFGLSPHIFNFIKKDSEVQHVHHIDAKKERKTDRAARVSAVFYCALTVNQMSRHNLGYTATSPLLDSRLIH